VLFCPCNNISSIDPIIVNCPLLGLFTKDPMCNIVTHNVPNYVMDRYVFQKVHSFFLYLNKSDNASTELGTYHVIIFST
jgi:hypothetical protein